MANWINLLDCIYPVGSIYISTFSTSPSSIVGGTWTAITAGATLLAAGTGFSPNSYGGSLKIDSSQLPAHTHPASNNEGPDGWDWAFTLNADWSSNEVARRYVGSASSGSVAMTSTDGKQAANEYLSQGKTTGANSGGEDYHPYGLNVYMWIRTA